MGYAEVTKHSNVRHVETDYTSDATDANVTNTDLPTDHSKSTLTKLTQLLDNSWQHCQHSIHILVSIVFTQCQAETTVR